MIEQIYQMYKQQKKMLRTMEQWVESDAERDLAADMKCSLEILDASTTEYSERYEREQAMQSSFTPEQIDFICYQIGDWYLEWKQRIIVDLEQGTYRLGFAKEQLKEMICGED